MVLVHTRLTTSPALLAKSLGASSYTTVCQPLQLDLGEYCTVALLSFTPLLHFTEAMISSHHMQGTRFQMDSLTLTVVGINAPATGADRATFLSTSLNPFLHSLQHSNDIVLCGDFNFVESPSLDKSSSTSYSGSGDRATFHSAIHPLGLLDAFRLMHPLRKECTLYSASTKSSSRIGRMFVSHSLLREML